MKSIAYNFTLSPEALAARDALAKELLPMPEIQEFMQQYACPEAVVVENAPQFKRWLERKRAVKTIRAEAVRQDESLGRFLDLRYDAQTGVLSEYFKSLPVLESLREERAYLNRYLVLPLAQSLQEASFEAIRDHYAKESQNYQKVVSLMAKFTSDDHQGYYLFGDLGVGKTYLAACVTNWYAKNGDWVAFIHVPTLLNRLKESFSNDDVKVDLSRLKRAKVLVLDDLGSEPITAWSRDEILLSILNDRYENKLKTIITSNCLPEQLVNLYKTDTKGSEDEIRARRLVDRILASTTPYEMTGANRRFANKSSNR